MEELTCKWLRERKQSEEAEYSVIPNMQHSSKGRTVETIKGLVTAGGQGLGGVSRCSARGRFRLGNYSACCYDGFMALCIYQYIELYNIVSPNINCRH